MPHHAKGYGLERFRQDLAHEMAVLDPPPCAPWKADKEVSATTPSRSRLMAASTIVALISSGCFLAGQRVLAQGSQAYLSAGAGATDLSGGVDWLLPRTRVAVGGEVGLGNLLWASLTVSYHPFARRLDRKAHPFLRVSATGVGSSPYNATGLSFGGGVTYWLGRRFGVRTEGVKFWPMFSEDAAVSSGPAFAPRLWATRAGIVFRW